jgi:DNA repair protein RecN (Recombination protein N)
MLTRLFIQNLATIEKQIIEFQPGFTALTGETGAGKSVIIKALRLILGEKCPKDLIRSDTRFLSVEASFDIREIAPVTDLLDDMDIEHDGELTIRRKVHLAGKNSIYLNEHVTNLATLPLFSGYLVDLHGQHSQQSLLSTSTHVDYLDAFAGQREVVVEFGEKFAVLMGKLRQKAELEQNTADRNREIDFLRFQVSEIGDSGFTEEEEKSLQDEACQLANGEQLISSLSPIVDWQGSDTSPLGAISSALAKLDEAVKLDPGLKAVREEMQSGLITLEEASSEIADYTSKLEINPGRLEEVNSRLAELDSLKRKYGPELPDIFRHRDNSREKLEQLESLELSYGELDQEIETETAQLNEQGDLITRRRKKAKEAFEAIIGLTLKELGMERSRFDIRIDPFQPKSESGPTYFSKGKDQVEFMIATNPGNPLKPLSRIASGGELSRVMLAIKTALNHDIAFGSMIFDEVDSGISGPVAETVGFKLVALGQSRQIICITHSPQIAAQATEHLKVEKVFEEKVSKTLVYNIKDQDRIEEIARFLGGNTVSDKSRSAAREMLTRQEGR